MKRICIGIFILLVLLAITISQWRTSRSVAKENERLQEKLAALENVEATNNDLQNERDQLLRFQDTLAQQIQLLRTDLGQLTTLTNELRAARLNQVSSATRLTLLDSENALLKTELVSKPRLPRVGGWLGVGIGDAREENPNAPNGVVIRSIVERGPAERANLEIGDVVLRVDGEVIGGTEDFKSILVQKAGGQPVRLEVIRKANVATVHVTLSDWPQ